MGPKRRSNSFLSTSKSNCSVSIQSQGHRHEAGRRRPAPEPAAAMASSGEELPVFSSDKECTAFMKGGGCSVAYEAFAE
uniref:Uncharacterized protein n=1 Tax=Setaria viridis TaxID=4556 RepID=A0A4V6DAM1_SETVI|nr:hypothetical protein SEVIR_2G041750v2 [Setaria viridis]